MVEVACGAMPYSMVATPRIPHISAPILAQSCRATRIADTPPVAVALLHLSATLWTVPHPAFVAPFTIIAVITLPLPARRAKVRLAIASGACHLVLAQNHVHFRRRALVHSHPAALYSLKVRRPPFHQLIPGQQIFGLESRRYAAPAVAPHANTRFAIPLSTVMVAVSYALSHKKRASPHTMHIC